MAADIKHIISRYSRFLRAGLGLVLLANCAPPVRAALPTPDPSATEVTSACREHTGQVLPAAVDSAVYGTSVALSVYLPPCYAAASERLTALYLLHGGNADETQWPDLRVQSVADDMIAHGAAPFVVVMPGGEYRSNLDYAAFVLDDLLPAVERQFYIRNTRAGRTIGGISLGGYWALKIAFLHPELFLAVGGHSPVVDRGEADDPLALAQTVGGLSQLAVTLDAGDGDALRTNTGRLARVLRERAVPVTFSTSAGGHNRVYWRAHTPAYLWFYHNALKTCTPNQCVRSRSSR